MKRRHIICFVLVFSLFFTSGCWDRKELNDRAIWLATGWDVGEKGGIQFSGQMVVPSNMQTQNGGGGSMGKGYFTILASGKNARDSIQNMQVKLSREAFFGQRRVTFFGEEFAKRGLKNELDTISRSADVSLRNDVFVVKGGTAKEMLNLSYPLENISVEAASKENIQTGGIGDASYLHFLIAANSEGIRPTLPAIEIGNSQDEENSGQENPSNTKLFRVVGAAIFDQNLKLLGFLNIDENRVLLWVMGILKKNTITVSLKDGSASLNLTKMGSKIVPELSRNNKIRFTVTLTGEGSLSENNSNLDVMQSQNIEHLQNILEKQSKKQVLQTISKVQKEYGTDIFGFGEAIHKKDPHEWKSLKKNWDQTFSEADVSVKVNLTIRRIGLTGPSLLFKESEIKE